MYIQCKCIPAPEEWHFGMPNSRAVQALCCFDTGSCAFSKAHVYASTSQTCEKLQEVVQCVLQLSSLPLTGSHDGAVV